MLPSVRRGGGGAMVKVPGGGEEEEQASLCTVEYTRDPLLFFPPLHRIDCEKGNLEG